MKMKSFIPPILRRAGNGESPFYLCECPACGCRRHYELGDPAEVIVNGEASAEGDAMETVEKIPSRCPQCGAVWKQNRMPDLRRY